MFREKISWQEREGAAAHPIHDDSEDDRGITGDAVIPAANAFQNVGGILDEPANDLGPA
jgi:hypothetical protein